MTSSALHHATRGVSPVLAYTLTLTVATLLVGGLLISSGSFVDTQREQTAISELRVVGQQVSADISAADRLARTQGVDDVRVGREIPQDVVGSPYMIEVRETGGPTTPYLHLSTDQPNVTVAVGVASDTPVATDVTVDGGGIEVVYSGGEVVVQSAD